MVHKKHSTHHQWASKSKLALGKHILLLFSGNHSYEWTNFSGVICSFAHIIIWIHIVIAYLSLHFHSQWWINWITDIFSTTKICIHALQFFLLFFFFFFFWSVSAFMKCDLFLTSHTSWRRIKSTVWVHASHRICIMIQEIWSTYLYILPDSTP